MRIALENELSRDDIDLKADLIVAINDPHRLPTMGTDKVSLLEEKRDIDDGERGLSKRTMSPLFPGFLLGNVWLIRSRVRRLFPVGVIVSATLGG